MDEVKVRLVEFLNYKGLDKSVFERMCGLANGFVDKTNSRMRRSSLNVISATFPELNTEWLMSGYGEMILCEDEQKQEQDATSKFDALIQRIDRLIEVHERDAKNMDRLLTLLEKSWVSETKEERVG